MLPNIALVGKQGAGKSSIAQSLVAEYGFTQMSWAAPVRQIFEMAYGPIIDYAATKSQMYSVTTTEGIVPRTGRELLQRIGTDAIRNNVDQEFWIKAGIQRIRHQSQTCNDDTRFLNEATALRGLGWTIVRVTAPEEVRKVRLGSAFVDGGHQSEIEQDHIVVDVEVTNDGTISAQELTRSLVADLERYLLS